MGEFPSPFSHDKETAIEENDSEVSELENNIQAQKDLNIVVLPAIEGDDSSDIFRSASESDLKNFHKLEKLIEFIKKIDRSRIWYCAEQVDYLIETFHAYKNRLEKIDQSKDSRDLIDQKISNSVKLTGEPKLAGLEISYQLEDHLAQSSKDTISLADSHTATYYSLKAAREASEDNNSDTVVFVFDNHRDVFTHADHKIWKGNIFRKLVQEKQIAGAVFFQNFDEPGHVYENAKAEDATPLIKTFNNYENTNTKLKIWSKQ